MADHKPKFFIVSTLSTFFTVSPPPVPWLSAVLNTILNTCSVGLLLDLTSPTCHSEGGT